MENIPEHYKESHRQVVMKNYKLNTGAVQGSEISIVVQGSIDVQFTASCLCALRTVFPDAEVILSTQDGNDVSGLPVDKVVFSPDPGAPCVNDVDKTLNNVNRQLVSTQAGIAAATRPYILKTRTDILFHNADFLKYFGQFDDAPSSYFQNRLLICNYYTRNPRVIDTCFHPSDWILFGRADDVRTYYENIPLMNQEDGEWFRTHVKTSKLFINHLSRFAPEQHIFLGFLQQHENVDCQCYYDHSEALVKQTERTFAECFVVLDYQKHLGITFQKYNPNRYAEKHTLTSHWNWKAMYSHYCLQKPSVLWIAYLCQKAMFATATRIRAAVARLLAYLGLKETVKQILRAVVK